MVGSVIVHNDRIIGEGWHYQAGQPHAEVNAINSVKDKVLLKEATIYVSLEPCSHFGKTPPCANLIIEHNIPNVVIGCVDSFSEVSGKGIQKLKNNGCNVTFGVLEEECIALNKRFFTYHNKKRPYIILKWAESADGFIAPINNIEITWITNTYSRQLVHKLRTEEQGILVGTNTAVTDNPKLNCRTWKGVNPVRVVMDRNLRIPTNHHLLDGSSKTIVLTEVTKSNSTNIFFETIDFSKSVASQICDVLYKHQLQSVIIEGGSKTLQHFIDTKLWDEAYVFKGSTVFTNGIKSPRFNGQIMRSKSVKKDTLIIYKNV
jgi:diaminohydroxyphosphoribosylaminopyrimidine deaminase/5-amino-6-(5-phosphoribosylamino)uracil reductase